MSCLQSLPGNSQAEIGIGVPWCLRYGLQQLSFQLLDATFSDLIGNSTGNQSLLSVSTQCKITTGTSRLPLLGQLQQEILAKQSVEDV
jgi:hypothetical protein